MIEIMEILQWAVIGVLVALITMVLDIAKKRIGDSVGQVHARCGRIEERLDELMTSNMKHRVKRKEADVEIDWPPLGSPVYRRTHINDVDLSTILDLILERLDVTVKPPESITEPAKLIPIEKPKKGQ
jgi:hypothetical protein